MLQRAGGAAGFAGRQLPVHHLQPWQPLGDVADQHILRHQRTVGKMLFVGIADRLDQLADEMQALINVQPIDQCFLFQDEIQTDCLGIEIENQRGTTLGKSLARRIPGWLIPSKI